MSGSLNDRPTATVTLREVIPILIIASMLFVAGLYLWVNRNKNMSVNDTKTTPIQKEVEMPTAKPTSPPTPTLMARNFSEIRNVFDKISKGEIVFNNKNDGVESYGSEYFNLTGFDLKLTEQVYLHISVYKYTKGAKFNSGYEGFEWVVDLDQWKSWLQQLKSGENKIKYICSDWGCGEPGETQVVTAKKMNANNYYISDGYFPPGGNSTRGYTTFDTKNSQIIDVRLDYYTNKESKEMIKVFSMIEGLLP